jgi:transcriptional regulator with XRE-family HTH domain
MPRLRMPDQVTDLGDYLREQREQARLSVRQLAQAAGVSNPYLSQIERGLRKPSADVLQQIAKGLRISAEALYVRAGILEESVGLDVEVAIRTDPSLTERQRRVLLEIYASFMAENGRAADAVPDGAAPAAPTVRAPKAAPAPRKRAARRTAKKTSTAAAEPVAAAGTGRTGRTASTTTRKTTRRAATRKAAAPRSPEAPERKQ